MKWPKFKLTEKEMFVKFSSMKFYNPTQSLKLSKKKKDVLHKYF
jgi:hypothetical protein